MLQKNDIAKSFQEVFLSMKEGVWYELTPDALEELNAERKAVGYSVLVPFRFTRTGKTLVIDWAENGWARSEIGALPALTLALTFAFALPLPLTLSLAFALSLAVPFTLAFAENRIRVAALDGTVREMEDGKKYRLTLVE